MRASLVILAVLGATLILNGRGSSARASRDREPTGTSPDSSFTTVEVFIDSHDRPLAAYQFDFKARDPRVRIVGIEGGEHAAFRTPPYYDPAAMEGDRVIAAAFSTHPAADLPAGRSRIVTLHLEVPADAVEGYDALLTTAADPTGRPVPAEISIVKGTDR